MKVIARNSFIRDIKKIKEPTLKSAILQAIESVEKANNLTDIPNLKSLKGFSGYYRIKPLPNKEYRIGLFLDLDTFEFICCLKRKDIYKFFPKNFK
jgi:mRNA interferase RelE/StbE